MKQIIQNYKTGELKLEEVPSPCIRPSSVVVRTTFSAISAGTEKTKVDTGKMSLLQKAKSRPDLVKKVIEKAKKEGLMSTYQMVQKRLSTPVPLGYSCVGIVEEVGEWVDGIRPGDRVACAGAGLANHAELNVVPSRLIAKLPAGTPEDQAAFTTIGSIALQGVRQAEPKIGERYAVIGLGLLGQITAQILRANGCEVFGIDLDPWKLKQAMDHSGVSRAVLASDPTLEEQVQDWSRGRGVDGVIVTASTPSDSPMEQAGLICREKGRVVIVGAVGTRFPREPYYMKELDIRLSRSYGPGRYDPNYEELGLDYPVGYVRFTEQRNLETFLDLLASRKVDISPLITHRFTMENSLEAFGLLSSEKQSEPYLGIVLDYGTTTSETSGKKETDLSVNAPAASDPANPLDLGFIGIGNYATSQLLPNLTKITGVRLKEVASGSGMSAALQGKQFGFEEVKSSPEAACQSTETGTLFVVTRHDSHAQYVIQGLRHGKNVFVEKPLCLNREELNAIQSAHEESKGLLCVGFNRRFSPLAIELREMFPTGAEHLFYRVNAGKLPSDHWLKIPEVGGGRLIGEGCHFIDFASYICRSPIRTVFATGSLRGKAQSVSPAQTEDVHITLTFENGSIATILYVTSGDSKLPKEFIEVHGGGRSAQLDDFMSLSSGGEKNKISRQDKGQAEMLRRYLEGCRSRDRRNGPISAEDLWNVSSATIAVIESLAAGHPILLDAK